MFKAKRYKSTPEEIEQNRTGNERQKKIDAEAKEKASKNKDASAIKNSKCADCEKNKTEIERLRNWHRQRSSYTEHPAEDLTKWQVYDRMPFQISENTVVMIRLFQAHNHLSPDLWLDDHWDIMRKKYGDKDTKEVYQRAADQFEKQLEGHYCIAFWEALRDKANQLIKEHEDRVSQKP